MNKHYILDGHEAKAVDLMEWAKWFENADRRVAETKVKKDVTVSTVFLGLNHQFGEGPPLVFETMIFGGPHDEYCERFETWEQAESGHMAAVKLASS